MQKKNNLDTSQDDTHTPVGELNTGTMNLNIAGIYNILYLFLDNFLDNLDHSFENKEKLDEIDDNFEKTNSNEHKSHGVKTKKQKVLFDDIKVNMDCFLNNFNSYFYEKIFHNVVGEIEKILEEKHEKKLEITKGYSNQIKEMEFLMTSGMYFSNFFRYRE